MSGERSASRAGTASGVNLLRLLGPFLSARLSDGSLRIAGACYGIATGAVEWV